MPYGIRYRDGYRLNVPASPTYHSNPKDSVGYKFLWYEPDGRKYNDLVYDVIVKHK